MVRGGLRPRTDRPSGDGWNNLGVALAHTGRPDEARQCFERALAAFAGYLDARMNLTAARPDRVTTHPLRMQPSRSEYS